MTVGQPSQPDPRSPAVPAANAATAPRTARRPLGAAILAVAIVVAIVASVFPAVFPGGGDGPDELTVVNGFGGVLKERFFDDEEIAEILADRYGLAVEIAVLGSIAMLNKACDGSLDDADDFLWAGDQSTVDIYRDCGGAAVGTGNVYNSPLVIYSWTQIVDALVASGYAEFQPDGVYTLDIARLMATIQGGGIWDDLGLTQYHGEIAIHTSDPNQSNSGFLFAGLLANMLNDGRVVTMATVAPTLPGIQAHFQRLGFMVGTSGALFEQFMQTGSGSKPLIAGYESQIFEYLVQNPQNRNQVQREVRLLYPEPTVWASHPLIARTDGGKRLLDALMDPDIQRLAWENHGQRPGVPGIPIDVAATGVPGIQERITSVINMPATGVMRRILDAIAAIPEGMLPASPAAVVSTSVAATVRRGRRQGARPWIDGG